MPDDSGPGEAQEKHFRCQGCGAALQYSPGTARLKCPYCGREHALEPPAGGPAREHDIAELEAVPASDALGFGTSTRQFKCDRCSAVSSIPGNLTASKCAFCGSDVVVEKPPLEGMVRPESLVPFAVTREQAAEKFREWLRRRWFSPGDLKKRAALAQMDGLYAPHFTFDAAATSRWSGEAGRYYEEDKARKVRWEHRSGTRQASYDDVLVNASRGLPENILRKIDPYHLKGLVPYAPEFLAGFTAEVYTVEPKEAWQRAQQVIRDMERRACSELLGGDTQRGLQVHTTLGEASWKHILLPAYAAAYAYGERIYRFLVNGQTGEVQGEAPVSSSKVAAAVAAGVAAIALLWRLGFF